MAGRTILVKKEKVSKQETQPETVEEREPVMTRTRSGRTVKAPTRYQPEVDHFIDDYNESDYDEDDGTVSSGVEWDTDEELEPDEYDTDDSFIADSDEEPDDIEETEESEQEFSDEDED